MAPRRWSRCWPAATWSSASRVTSSIRLGAAQPAAPRVTPSLGRRPPAPHAAPGRPTTLIIIWHTQAAGAGQPAPACPPPSAAPTSQQAAQHGGGALGTNWTAHSSTTPQFRHTHSVAIRSSFLTSVTRGHRPTYHANINLRFAAASGVGATRPALATLLDLDCDEQAWRSGLRAGEGSFIATLSSQSSHLRISWYHALKPCRVSVVTHGCCLSVTGR
jgi:hypothetical protein